MKPHEIPPFSRNHEVWKREIVRQSQEAENAKRLDNDQLSIQLAKFEPK